MRQFWMVWNVGGNAPRHQHEYEHLAITEAERLARAHPGEAFVVLRLEGMADDHAGIMGRMS